MFEHLVLIWWHYQKRLCSLWKVGSGWRKWFTRGLYPLPLQAQALCCLVQGDSWRPNHIRGCQATLPCFLLDNGLDLLGPGTNIRPDSFKLLPSGIFVSTRSKITNTKLKANELYKGIMADMMVSPPEINIRSFKVSKAGRKEGRVL